MSPDVGADRLLDALPDPTIGIDAEGVLRWGNRAAEALFGWSAAERVGLSALELVHPDDLQLALLSLNSIKSKDTGTPIDVRVRTAGGWRLVEAVGSNHFDDPGLGCMVMTLRDLTERRRWEVGRGDDAAFRAVVQNAASLLLLVAPDGTVTAASGALPRLLGVDQEALEGRPLVELVTPADRGELLRRLGHREAGGHTPVTIEVGLVRSDGRSVPFELSLVDLTDDPTVSGIVVSGHDITQLRLMQDTLEDLAWKDPLTMLANRAVVDRRLGELLGAGARVAVAFVDLDGFKALNDQHGHVVGDQVLRAVADRIAGSVRQTDVAARFGGDEFVVLAIGGPAEANELAIRLREVVSRPVEIDGTTISVSASVGVVDAEPGDDPVDVLDRADRLMYHAKAVGTRGRAESLRRDQS